MKDVADGLEDGSSVMKFLNVPSVYSPGLREGISGIFTGIWINFFAIWWTAMRRRLHHLKDDSNFYSVSKTRHASAPEAMSSSRWSRSSFNVSAVGWDRKLWQFSMKRRGAFSSSCSSFQRSFALTVVGREIVVVSEEQNNLCNQHQSHGVTSSRRSKSAATKEHFRLDDVKLQTFCALNSARKDFPAFLFANLPLR